MSKRKSRKSSSLLGIFLLTALILILITAYLYRRNPEFKAKADKFSAEAQEKSEKALADIEGRIGEITKNFNDFTKSEENAPTEQEQSKSAEESQKSESEKSPSSEKQKSPAKNSAPKKLVALPVGLEKPICAGIHGSGDHQIREFEHYSICYRESYEQAEWSAYCLTEEELVKNAKRTDDFRSDPEISTGSATPADYKKSGYDRGHLSPAADFAFDAAAMSETFYMSNMSPQAGGLNRGIWKDLEAEVRLWAANFGRVYVVSGPILEKAAGEYESIGENHVTVPEFYYKVILAPLYKDEEDKATPETAESVIATAYIFPNEKCAGTIDDYAVSVDEVEKRTKLDFFSLLEDTAENEIEGKITGKLFKEFQLH